jgi:hypothetical protein
MKPSIFPRLTGLSTFAIADETGRKNAAVKRMVLSRKPHMYLKISSCRLIPP